MEFRHITINELKEWTEFCGQIFPVGPEYFMRHYQNDPYKDINGIFIAKDETGMASSVRVFTRYLRIKGTIIKVGGIGEVCTKESHRALGLSAKLLNMAIEYMNLNDMPLSILHTGSNHHYSKLGWFAACSDYKVFILRKSELKEGYTCTKACDKDFPFLKALYEEYAHTLGPVFVRSDEYYETWVKSELKNTYVLKKDNQIVSYADCSLKPNQGVLVKEYIAGEYISMIKPFFYSICVAESWPKIIAVSSPFAKDVRYSTRIIDYGRMFRINKPFEIDGRIIRYQENLFPYLTDFPELHIDGY